MQVNVAHFRDRISQSLKTSRLAILCEIVAVLLFAKLMLHLGRLAGGGWLLTLIASLVILLGISGLLLFRHSWWTDYGLKSPNGWFRTLGSAILLVITLIILNGFIRVWINRFVGESYKDIFDGITVTKASLVWILIGIWTMAAFGEEMLFRGYLLNRVADLFNRDKVGWTVGVLVSSVLFGLMHYYQGYMGVLVSFVIGLAFGIAYIRVDFSLWVPIFAHGIYDTLFVLTHYSG
jgi:membrane protease YdiL (CAAX protease family)